MISNFKTRAQSNRKKVAWIHCNYHPNRLTRCLDLAEIFLRKLGLLENALLICVNNYPESSVNANYTSWIQLQGSNQSREFSAWKEGWTFVESVAPGIDAVILTNDTFPFHQPYEILAPLLRVSLGKLLKGNENHWALGVVERGFDYEDLPEYITSFFVALDRAAAFHVIPHITEATSQCWIAENAALGKIVFSNDKIYENSINNWLLKPGRYSWYAASPLTQENHIFMAGKARCIILEHSLSRNLCSHGVRLISCFDLPLGVLARWYLRLHHMLRSKMRN